MSKSIKELKELVDSGSIDWVYTLNIKDYSSDDLKELYVDITECKPRGSKKNIVQDLQNFLYQRQYSSDFDASSSSTTKSENNTAFVLVPQTPYLQPNAEKYGTVRESKVCKFRSDLEKVYNYKEAQRFICIVNNELEAERIRNIIYNEGYALTKIESLLSFDSVYTQFNILGRIKDTEHPVIAIIHTDLEPKLAMEFKEKYKELGRL